MTDRRYLLCQKAGWYAVVEVPPSLRAKVGARRLKQTLRTQDVAIARARRWRVVAALKATIEQARRAPEGSPLVAEALEYREAMVEARKAAAAASFRGDHDDPEAIGAFEAGLPDAVLEGAIVERAEQLSTMHGDAAAVSFADVAFGRTTPLALHVEPWLAEGGPKSPELRPRTKLERRRAVAALSDWLAGEGLTATVEVVTRKVAGRYVSALLGSGRERPTLAKRVRSLRAYWDWLRRRGHVDEDLANPWAEQVPAVPASGEEKERAFTDAEVARLLGGGADRTLDDFMRVAALTGMRREEIAQMKVGDCAGGVFVVQRGKTAAARRRVPVHPDLAAIISRRTSGKPSGAFLFDDLESSTGDRSDPLGKRFTRYRRRLDVQEGEGRRSLVNLHSFRRWFITKAINAGRPPHVVSLVVGHTEGREGMTLSRYWSGAEDAALRDVVEAVTLPAVEAIV